jgi:hypothetical protein
MPTFIKTGFWEKTRKGYKEWLNLDEFISSKVPTPKYKVYSALLNQSGTSDPEPTVLENTLGVLTFDYVSLGNYKISTSGLFTLNKTFATIASSNSESVNFIYINNVNEILISSKDLTAASTVVDFLGIETQVEIPNAVDGLVDTSIEIRVYN